MIYTRSGADALANRYDVVSPGTGNQHWGTTFFGKRVSTEAAPGPQATMSELQPNETINPHFHGVTMFQLFLAGSGTLGARAQEIKPLTIQFKDHHTAYGPIISGDQGLTFTALRMISSKSLPVYLDKPGYREELKPSKRRNLSSDTIPLSIEPVMQHRKDVVWETKLQADDGMHAQVVRMGAGAKVQGPDPKLAGGYYVVVANGSLVHDGEELPLWSMVVVENTEKEFLIQAGPKGLEALVLQFPLEHE